VDSEKAIDAEKMVGIARMNMYIYILYDYIILNVSFEKRFHK